MVGCTSERTLRMKLSMIATALLAALLLARADEVIE
jgi:hypothetical protein